MRWVKAIIAIWVVGRLLMWIRGYAEFSIIELLPFMDRRHPLPPEYDLLAVGMLVAIAACARRKEDEK